MTYILEFRGPNLLVWEKLLFLSLKPERMVLTGSWSVQVRERAVLFLHDLPLALSTRKYGAAMKILQVISLEICHVSYKVHW